MIKQKYILTLLFLLLPLILFHKRIPGSLEESVKDATLIGTGIIESVETYEERCSTTTTVKLKNISILKGSLGINSLIMETTDYHWREKIFPWQEDCPSVHYVAPPFEVRLEKDEKIIFAAKQVTGYAEYYVTAAVGFDRIDWISKIAGIK